jgi:hypothetical protein
MGSICKCVQKSEDAVEDTYSSSNELNVNIKCPSSGDTPVLEYNDTVIKPSLRKGFTSEEMFDDKQISLSRFNSLRDSYRKPTLTWAQSLAQAVKFSIGNELLCMTWNLHHGTEYSPFEFYCDFRTIGLKEHDTVMIEIIWDVARVLLYTDLPTQLCKQTLLSSCVPPHLLSPETCSKFCRAAGISDDEAALVMGYPGTTLNDFLLTHSYRDNANKVLKKEFSFTNLNRKNVKRASSPLQVSYQDDAWKQLLEDDPTLLPLLILDSLHVLVIRFSVFLIEKQLQMAFSEFLPNAQIDRLTAFFSEVEFDNLALPRHFASVKRRLYKKWNIVFHDSNKVHQLMNKASQTNTDIILVQQLTESAFEELIVKSSDDWTMFPKEFPASENETTAVCLRKATVRPAKGPKIRHLDAKTFAVLCESSDILFYLGVVDLPKGEAHTQLRQKQALTFRQSLGKSTPVIVGGNFNEDLTVYDNAVAKIMLRDLNGIDHTQEQPLAFSVNRTRTNLQFEISKADRLENGVVDGIFSSFPLVGEAFTDFLHSGFDNPSDHGPIFQRILLGLF